MIKYSWIVFTKTEKFYKSWCHVIIACGFESIERTIICNFCFNSLFQFLQYGGELMSKDETFYFISHSQRLNKNALLQFTTEINFCQTCIPTIELLTSIS